MKKIIISTVGTSILSNGASKEERIKLYNESNCIKENECPDESIKLVQALEAKTLQELTQESNVNAIRRFSAELNGIFGFYDKEKINKEDFHFLITTDTYQGVKSGKILSDFLNSKKINNQIFTPQELTTRKKYNFEQGIKNLLKWCDETLSRDKNSGYEIVFNLTGSFKSLQGYMNTIAMFYADKIIYIFESKKAELIEIPRLPIEIDKHIFEQNKEEIILMDAGYYFDEEKINDIPRTIIDKVESKCFLSVWGELLWNRTKKEILTSELISLPYLDYSDEFKKIFSKATESDKIELQETLAKVSKILIENKGNPSKLKQDGGLQYDNFVSKKDDNGNVIGHFRINQADRVSCVYRNEKLFLRKFGRHDFVNDNP